ncbi:MAG: hypothetical protein PHS62_02985 [Patescibacteria group bacterium]|nr:hypothetical protein [Patescibacteria group bacterium]
MNNVQLGSLVLTAGATEGVAASSVSVHLSTAEAAAVVNMGLRDHNTGATLGTVKYVPGTANNYSLPPNIILTTNGSRTIDLYADVKSSATPGTWQATVSADGSGMTTGAAVSAPPQDLQTITIVSGGTLTAACGNMPDSAILIAGSTGNHVAQHTFSAMNEGFTVNELKFTAPYYFALSTAGVTIEYYDRSGRAQQANSVFVTGPGPNTNSAAIATFTGLTMYVPNDANAWFDVDIDLGTIAAGAFSGASGAITLLANEGFSATGDSGTVITSLGANDLTGNTFYIRKSKPTFTMLDAGTDPVNGPLYRFSVVADNAGGIDIKQVGLQVRATGCNVSGLYLYDPNTSTVLTDVPEDLLENGNVFLPVGTFNWFNAQDTLAIGSTPKVYEVWSTVTGYNEPGDSITVTFRREWYMAPNSTAYDIGAHYSGGVIWSDRSAPMHSTFSEDWFNGFLVKGTDGVKDGVQTFTR